MWESISIQKDHLEIILKQINFQPSIEICGIIAGEKGHSKKVYPITNILQSSTRYRMAPEEQIKALLEIEDKAWDLLAIYHSHPAGPPHPSYTDITEVSYPDSVYLVFSPYKNTWNYKGFIISGENVQEVEIIIDESK